ncbi:class II histone deacetylase [Aliiruegeria sabulilitoris]|uniref:class II histone deacetylase n=1 Tax=Aliiruegeria sabulilitoris TaxID=1510458 RepID=UPI0008360139|nr:class II histone deacetylase [Aliiruegeria sabulilitoris]NDR59412.1 class II histone deacetylase [Pseudoruegeria sp. M32A2M]
MTTGFYWDERCFWHGGGNYALTLPVGGLVQPIFGGLPENPETKRRLLNLMRVTGLDRHLSMRGGEPATEAELARVHPRSYPSEFRSLSAQGGGELGLRAPFGQDGYEIAALSAGLARTALFDVLKGAVDNAYALSRPPGHHCLPEFPNGFCLLANISIAIEAALAEGLAERVAVVDWDVHHGNGTEAIFYDRSEVLTISVHQEHNYPLDTGDAEDRGAGAGLGTNMNIPLPPGTGHRGYLAAFDRLVLPALEDFRPDCIIVACGYDASAFDPLAQMMASADTYRCLTARVKEVAEDLCDGRLMLVHEGGYSEVYVPFCGHAALEALSNAPVTAPDPMADTVATRQPGPRHDRMIDELLSDLEDLFGNP